MSGPNTPNNGENLPNPENNKDNESGIYGKTKDALSDLLNKGAELLGLDSKADTSSIDNSLTEPTENVPPEQNQEASLPDQDTTQNESSDTPENSEQNEVPQNPETSSGTEKNLYESGLIKSTDSLNETISAIKFPSKYSDILNNAKGIVEFKIQENSLNLFKPIFTRESAKIKKSIEIPTDPSQYETFLSEVMLVIQTVLSDSKYELPPKNKYSEWADKMEQSIATDPKYAEYKNSALVLGIISLLKLFGRFNSVFDSFMGGDMDSKINAKDSEYKDDNFDSNFLETYRQFAGSTNLSDEDISDQIPKNLNENAASTMYTTKKLFGSSYSVDALEFAAKLDHSRYSNPSTGASDYAFSKIKDFNVLKSKPMTDLQVGTVLFFTKKSVKDGKEISLNLTGMLVRTQDGSVKLEYYNKHFGGGKRELVDLYSADISLQIAYEPTQGFISNQPSVSQNQESQNPPVTSDTPQTQPAGTSDAQTQNDTSETPSTDSQNQPSSNQETPEPTEKKPPFVSRRSRRVI